MMVKDRLFLEIATFVLGVEKTILSLEADLCLDPESEKLISCMYDRVKLGEPLAYVLGEVDFFTCTIEVNRSALIPRVETELLVEYMLDEIDASDNGVFLDLCSGTGCLGLAIKKYRPNLKVILSDVSPKCVELARKNCQRNNLDVTLCEGDLFDPVKKLRRQLHRM